LLVWGQSRGGIGERGVHSAARNRGGSGAEEEKNCLTFRKNEREAPKKKNKKKKKKKKNKKKGEKKKNKKNRQRTLKTLLHTGQSTFRDVRKGSPGQLTLKEKKWPGQPPPCSNETKIRSRELLPKLGLKGGETTKEK